MTLFMSCSSNNQIHPISGAWQSVSSSENQFLTTIGKSQIKFESINTKTGVVTGGDTYKIDLKEIAKGYEITAEKFSISIKLEKDKLYMRNI